MTARWIFVCALVALTGGSGCCCYGPQGGALGAGYAAGGYGAAGCGPGRCGVGGGCSGGACRGPGGPFAGGACCLCLPKPIIWCGEQNECGPAGCQSCAGPTECGILPAMRRCLTCGKGCGEVYLGEWISDPPDCCDPCDKCFGQWTGPHGCCSLGPCQRLLAALHGYRYCPRPACGQWCGLFCSTRACNTCSSCGGAGCATCGGGPGGPQPAAGDVYYENAPPAGGQSILNEDWNRPPAPSSTPGKPIHKAEQPGPMKLGQAAEQPAPPMYGRMVRTAAYWGR